MRNRETPTILGAPSELKVLTDRKNPGREKGQGRFEKQAPLEKREGFGWRRKRIVEVSVVLLSDPEAFHIW